MTDVFCDQVICATSHSALQKTIVRRIRADIQLDFWDNPLRLREQHT